MLLAGSGGDNHDEDHPAEEYKRKRQVVIKGSPVGLLWLDYVNKVFV